MMIRLMKSLWFFDCLGKKTALSFIICSFPFQSVVILRFIVVGNLGDNLSIFR